MKERCRCLKHHKCRFQLTMTFTSCLLHVTLFIIHNICINLHIHVFPLHCTYSQSTSQQFYSFKSTSLTETRHSQLTHLTYLFINFHKNIISPSQQEFQQYCSKIKIYRNVFKPPIHIMNTQTPNSTRRRNSEYWFQLFSIRFLWNSHTRFSCVVVPIVVILIAPLLFNCWVFVRWFDLVHKNRCEFTINISCYKYSRDTWAVGILDKLREIFSFFQRNIAVLVILCRDINWLCTLVSV